MVKRKISWKIRWIDILIIALFLLSVYLILTRILGHSASDLTISIGLFTFLAGLVYYTGNNVMNYIVRLNREIGEMKTQMLTSFKKVKEDITKLQKSGGYKK